MSLPLSRPLPAEPAHIPDVLPLVPLRDAVVFPTVIVPLSVGPDSAAAAIDHALGGDRLVLLVAQRDSTVDQPDQADLFEIGTVAQIIRILRLPDGRMRILAQGVVRARLQHIGQREPFLLARVTTLEDTAHASPLSVETRAAMRDVVDSMDRAMNLGRPIAPDVIGVASQLDDPGRLADLAASNLELDPVDSQPLLENTDPLNRLGAVAEHLHRELHLLGIQHELASQARDELDRTQREYVLRQQLRAIQEELGDADDFEAEVAGYREAAKEKKLSEEAVEELDKQLRRLERSHPDSAETTVIRTYLDWLTNMPWGTLSDDQLDLDRARQILDEDHFGLEKIKERIIEVIAVRRLKPDARGPILCFVGPPGVGKTSLGRSIARALGRGFTRLSLGGVRDEAEVRGHRRTYVGAMPGRILQGLHQAGTSNPVFMLDEIDKIGRDGRGDPEAALLEVLDPEQNTDFRDHYLALGYDLSRVMFITTANQLEPIQAAFLDRMEVIHLPGYTEEEKRAIARCHLLPKQLEAHGLDQQRMALTDAALRMIIRSYTRESGLRNFERKIAAICRKVAVRVADGRDPPARLGTKAIRRMLGVPTHDHEDLLDRDRVGVATGLAWTATGGELLHIEVSTVPGTGKLNLTGKLGDVMKESAQAALTYVQGYAERHALAQELFTERDIHIHVPAGAVPKDGPSAGITIATALISVLTDRPVRHTLAMTGEVTLRGTVLAIGGLKEKALAARTAGIETVIIPEPNRRDIAELPANLKRAIRFCPFDHMDDVAEAALVAREQGGHEQAEPAEAAAHGKA